VARGDFPRSRLGEKQRGRILASWVGRKLRTIAQFAIRDADSAESCGVQNSPTKSPSVTTGGGKETPVVPPVNKTLDLYQLPVVYPSIPENQTINPHDHPQYSHQQGQGFHQTEEPSVYYEMPANMPAELPAGNGDSSQGTLNQDSNAVPKVVHKPQTLSPPKITTAYGDLALGNPYADDDALATPTPTQRSGIDVDSVGYPGNNAYANTGQSTPINPGNEFLGDAFLQLRFEDGTGEGGYGGHSEGVQPSAGGYGTAL